MSQTGHHRAARCITIGDASPANRRHAPVRVQGARLPEGGHYGTPGSGRDGVESVLVFTIQPGAQRASARSMCRVSQVARRADPETLHLQPGNEYDGVELDERLADYATDLRDQGYYEARVVQLPRYTDDGAVNVVLSIEQGPRIEIIFEGDALERADRERLVPIAREHSVDEDLLEDSKFGIERHFRERGHCNPRADYRRTEADGVLRITFTITHGPRCVLESAEVSGNETLTSAELAPLVADARRRGLQ